MTKVAGSCKLRKNKHKKVSQIVVIRPRYSSIPELYATQKVQPLKNTELFEWHVVHILLAKTISLA